MPPATINPPTSSAMAMPVTRGDIIARAPIASIATPRAMTHPEFLPISSETFK